jgi:hypothetical protein
MISQKFVAAQSSPNRDARAGFGHQGPMSLQNSCNLGSYQLHPQKLVRLVGCRDLNARNQKVEISFPPGRESRLQY